MAPAKRTTRRAPAKNAAAPAGGRPPAVDQRLDNGRTVGEQIALSIRAGNYFEQSCAAAGIGRNTGLRWLRDGALAARRVEIADGDENAAGLNDNQRAYLRFWRAVTEAEATWEVAALTTLEQLSRGAAPDANGQMRGPSKRVETEKLDARGNVTERTVRTEWLPPDPQVIQWRLERKDPTRFGKRVEITSGTVGDPLTRPDRAELLAEQLEAWLAQETDEDTPTGR